MEKIDCVYRKHFDFEHLGDPGAEHQQHLEEHHSRSVLEHFFHVPSEVRIVVLDRVQLHAKCARADHIC